jgi:hypothetical protein
MGPSGGTCRLFGRLAARAAGYSEPVYVLTHADGRDLHVTAVIWEAALALAFAYGWVPAGTGSPTTVAWQNARQMAGLRVWDRQDYFSRHSQHVERKDARELAGAVLRGLLFLPGTQVAREPEAQGPKETVGGARSAALQVAVGMTERRRSLLRSVALFADSGGFTID